MHLRLWLRRKRRLVVVFLKIKKLVSVIITSLLLVFLSGCSLSTFFVDKQIREVYDILDNYYYKELDFKVTDVKDLADLFERLNDPYTYIYEKNTRTIEKDEAYDGLGITISDGELGLLISDLNLDAKFTEKIYVGDIITKVNDQSLADLSFTEKQDLLSGNLGDILTLYILRGDDYVTIDIEVREIPLPSTTYHYDPMTQIGYIDINRFSNLTSTQVKNYLSQMEANGLKGLIFDVRNNGGGYLNAVVEIIQLFLSGTDPFLYMVRSYDQRITEYKPYQGIKTKNYPISILQNQYSASASEVLAQALNIGIGADLIGEKSYGKDVYQVSYPLTTFNNDVYLNMTQGYWLTKNQGSISGGIEPTITFNGLSLSNLGFPSYQNNYVIGEESSDLIVYQYILNLFDESDVKITNYGLFDQLTYDKLLMYQQINQLPLTGKLDDTTMFALIDLYHQYKKDLNQDSEYLFAIEQMRQSYAS